MALVMITVSPPKNREKKFLKSFKKHFEPLHVFHWVEEHGKNEDHPHYHIVCSIPAGQAINKSRLLEKLPSRFTTNPFCIRITKIPNKTVFNQYVGYCTKEINRVIIQSNIDESDYLHHKPTSLKLNIRKGMRGSQLAYEIIRWLKHYYPPIPKEVTDGHFNNDVYPWKERVALFATLYVDQIDICDVYGTAFLVKRMYADSCKRIEMGKQTITADYNLLAFGITINKNKNAGNFTSET